MKTAVFQHRFNGAGITARWLQTVLSRLNNKRKAFSAMLFSSNPFLFFFLPIVLLLYYGIFRHIKNITPRNILLLIASLFFYGWGERYFVYVLMVSILANWLFGLLVDKYRERKKAAYLIITLSCIFNLAIIFVGKYLVFTMTNINALFRTDFSLIQVQM